MTNDVVCRAAIFMLLLNPTHLGAAHCHPAEALPGEAKARPVEPSIGLRSQLIRGRHLQDVRSFLNQRAHLREEGEEREGARAGGDETF